MDCKQTAEVMSPQQKMHFSFDFLLTNQIQLTFSKIQLKSKVRAWGGTFNGLFVFYPKHSLFHFPFNYSKM